MGAPAPFALGQPCASGAEIAHFTFGSAVIVTAPEGTTGAMVPAVGADLRMGQRLWDAAAEPPERRPGLTVVAS